MFNLKKGDKEMITSTKPDANDTAKSSSAAQTVDIIRVEAEGLVKRMVALNPNIVGKLPDKRVQAIVRGTMMALAQEVNEREEGQLQVSGLGRITIRQFETEKDGSPATVKRVTLNPAKPKPKV
tara:strand:+ start:12187 stop:12558 length:372 start_codon:yes stop_codon:yes gene_type:complete